MFHSQDIQVFVFLTISQKHKNLDIPRMKQYFFFKSLNSLITHQGLRYDKE